MSSLPSTRPATPSPLTLMPRSHGTSLYRTLSRSHDSVEPGTSNNNEKKKATARTPLLIRSLHWESIKNRASQRLKNMSSYGAIGDDNDELDRLLAAAPSSNERGRPIPPRGSGMRRVASAVDSNSNMRTSSSSAADVRRVTSGVRIGGGRGAGADSPVVGSVERRGPYLYTGGIGLGDASMGSTHSLTGSSAVGGGSGNPLAPGALAPEDPDRAHNMAIRYRLFNRLDPGGQTLRMPDHVTPPQYFSILPFDEFMDSSGKQGSFVTIFSLWNTMMGTSLLAMPWAIQQAGLVLGVVLMLAIAGLCLFTAYLVVESPKGLTMDVDSSAAEFSDVCRYLFGKWGERCAVWFSVVVLLGGVMVYWVLMSNFLYYTGTVVYDALQPNSTTIPIMENKTFTCDVYCPTTLEATFSDSLALPVDEVYKLVNGGMDFDSMWQLRLTVPVYLALLCFPLLNFKSPTFFTKFNVLGTISVFYLLSFTASKLVECGFNLDFSSKTSIHYAELFSWKFPALTGTLTLSYFIHNAVLTILRNQKHPENNARDLSIGYALAAFCYVFIGVAFYSAFPVQRSCISDNFLNNFGTGDVMSATARLFLLFQMLTVLPLLMYLIRTQFFYATTGTTWPGLTKVCTLNAIVIAMAVTIAIVYPKVGSILRYVGSFSGLVYVFALPCLVYMKKLQMDGKLSERKRYALYGIVGLGVANLIAQFCI